MWKKLRWLLILLSAALNVAFITIWATHTLPAKIRDKECQEKNDGVWCSLHRRLGTTEKQWREIEPCFLKFRKSAQCVCGDVNRARAELIDLIAMPNPDTAKIKQQQEKILVGQRRMQELVINYLLSEKKSLTPAQQQDLFDMLRRRSGCSGHGPTMNPLGAGKSCHSTKSVNKNCHGQRKEDEGLKKKTELGK